MSGREIWLAFATGGALVAALLVGSAQSQLNQPRPNPKSPAPPNNSLSQPPQPRTYPASIYSGAVPAAALLRVPVTGVIPGNINTAPDISNPLANDPNAVQRGMRDFDAFNCSGCHAANGAGGMGPSLSNDSWIYRSSPANIYLTIVQGRAKGMPAWGAMLPDRTVWELVAYIKSISEKPDGKFGKTTSASPESPNYEQVPAEEMETSQPWNYTEPFSNGQKPGRSP